MFLQQRLSSTPLGCGRQHRHPQQPQIESATQQEGCVDQGCINSGRLTPQNNRGCFTQQISAEFFRGNQQKRSSAFTSTSTSASTSKRRTTTSRAPNFQTTVSRWKTLPQQRLLREQLRTTWSIKCTTVVLEIDFTDCATKIINDEFAFIINKWFNNSFVIIDLRSSQLHILSSTITHRSIEGGDNDNMYINLGKKSTMTAQGQQKSSM